jgi:putative oxidoreductase
MKEGTHMSVGERDFASLILRSAIGPMLIAHGTNKVFGSGGLEGTTRWFNSLGLQPAAVHARMAAATEITSGALITLGAGNPLPSAAVVGLMTTAALTDHKGKGFFVFKGGWEYTAVVAAAATALAGLGYGRWSLDRLLRRKSRSGVAIALGTAALGVAAAAGLLATSYRPELEDAAGEAGSGGESETPDTADAAAASEAAEA